MVTLFEFVLKINQQMNRFICDLQFNLYKEKRPGWIGMKPSCLGITMSLGLFKKMSST